MIDFKTWQYVENESVESRLAKIKAIISEHDNSFPYKMEPFRSQDKSPIPARAYSFTLVSLCRMMDLSDAAHQMLVEKRLVPAASLARAAFETMALQYWVAKKIRNAMDTKTITEEGVGKDLMVALMGQKDENFPHPKKPYEAVNILTAVNH